MLKNLGKPPEEPTRSYSPSEHLLKVFSGMMAFIQGPTVRLQREGKVFTA